MRFLPLAALVVAAGCAPQHPQLAGPKVIGLSKEKITVGETLYFSGEGFAHPKDGKTVLEFSGVYYWHDDAGRMIAEDVPSFTIAPVFDGSFPDGGDIGDVHIKSGGEVLRWNRFGPYLEPFGGDGHHTGLFKGTVTASNVGLDGSTGVSGEPTEVSIEIQPSVLITKLEPVVGLDDAGGPRTADCKKPALRVFGGMPYVMTVEAMGFTPAYFIYDIANINGSDDFVTFTHAATGATDTIGDAAVPGEVIMFNPLSPDVDYSVAAIRVTAVAADNTSIATAMPVPVVRPVRVEYDGNRELGEYYEPVPVYGPIVGGIGTEVTYAETTSESRQDAVSVQFNQSVLQSTGTDNTKDWNQGYGIDTGTQQTNGTTTSTSEADSSAETYGTQYDHSTGTNTDVSSTNGTDWGWTQTNGTEQEQYQSDMNHLYGTTSGSVDTEVGGEGSIPGLGSISGHVGTTVGTQTESGSEKTSGTRNEQSSERGSSMNTSASSTNEYGSTTTDGNSQSMSGTYGVERQSGIDTATSQTQSTDKSITYDMGGSASVSSGYQVGSETDWQQSWVSTTEQEDLLSFSGKVPNGRCAVIYRQTVRYVRTAQMYTYDQCGVRDTVGELTFNEWSWSPNIAIGDDCEATLPPSTQPKAQCFKACE